MLGRGGMAKEFHVKRTIPSLQFFRIDKDAKMSVAHDMQDAYTAFVRMLTNRSVNEEDWEELEAAIGRCRLSLLAREDVKDETTTSPTTETSEAENSLAQRDERQHVRGPAGRGEVQRGSGDAAGAGTVSSGGVPAAGRRRARKHF